MATANLILSIVEQVNIMETNNAQSQGGEATVLTSEKAQGVTPATDRSHTSAVMDTDKTP